MYDYETILDYVEEENVKFIRLAFTDIYGTQKNVSIMPHELKRAFKYGVSIDRAAIKGFGGNKKSDIFLFPNPDTIAKLPWRPSQGRVIRMYCDIKYPNGDPFECDTRNILKNKIEEAKKLGLEFNFGSEIEFYLFKCDQEGNPTNIPYDDAGYMDIAPKDKGENVRREICLTLEEMEILPESSHHEEGKGQNEVAFRYSDALQAADDALTFKSVVSTIAARNGLYASFEPKPLLKEPGNGYHINVSIKSENNLTPYAIEGILRHSKEMTAFLNPIDNSYDRLGYMHAPRYVSWSSENRSDLIRIPAAKDQYQRFELRQADPKINPYLAFALIIDAAIDGIKNKYELRKEEDLDVLDLDSKTNLERLPKSLDEAKSIALKSEFIKNSLPSEIIDNYLK